MKQLMVLVIALMLAICCISCQQGSSGDLQKKVAELQKKVDEQAAALKKRDNDVATLSAVIYSAAVSNVFGSPLDNFFGAAEFWENTYEVDPSASCYKSCADAFNATVNNRCKKISDPDERQACMTEAYQTLEACSGRCK